MNPSQSVPLPMSNSPHTSKPHTTEKTCGSWPSSITADLLSENNISLSEPRIDGDTLYWLENRPHEQGRNAIVQMKDDGSKRDILPQSLNVRSRVNEYGGGSYCVANNIVYFVLADDQRVYRLDLNKASSYPQALSPEAANRRYGNLVFDFHRQQIIAVCEDHGESLIPGENQEASTYLVSIRASIQTNNSEDETASPMILLRGADFYSSPAISPDGKQITWLSWNHPNMPWDASECWVANIDNKGQLSEETLVAGGDNESIFQPTWSPDGRLYFLSDKNNWTNLYRYHNNKVTIILEKNLDFATPQWVFGLSTFGFISAEKIVCCYSLLGIWKLAIIDCKENTAASLLTIETELNDISAVQANQQGGVFIGASATSFPALYQINDQHKTTEIHQSNTLKINAGELSAAQRITFPTLHNTDTGAKNEDQELGHAFFYPPRNKSFTANEKELPPCIALCHGGPTTATRASLNLKIQYWTNRGFAIVDINYRGSTGYGRHYRDQLKGKWGIVDVEDAIACVNFLSKEKRIDKEKLAIKGGSAGGYTVLAALTFHEVFKAGASYYGIGNLETLATDTHKFESRYLDSLVGPYPEQQSVYYQRSPLNFVEKLNCPIIFLQGLQDKVVPPDQAEEMVSALDEKKIPHAYVQFENEGHGFRQSGNIKRAIEAEYYFYSQVFGFNFTDTIEPVAIAHEELLKARHS